MFPSLRVRFVALWWACLISLFALSAARAVPVSRGKLVLRLPYRGDLAAGRKRPYSLGMKYAQEGDCTGNFLGADWHGNFYLSDPVDFHTLLLRQFDKTGKLRQSWEIPQSADAYTVAVTKDDYVWVAANTTNDAAQGVGFVIFKFGQKTPVADWRNHLPPNVQKRLETVVEQNHLNPDLTRSLNPYDVVAGTHRVLLECTGAGLGAVNRMVRMAWLVCDSAGHNIVQAGVSAHQEPRLSPKDSLQWQGSDLDLSTYKWHQQWLWSAGESHRSPIIDRTLKPEPYAPFLLLKDGGPASIAQDARSCVYLVFSRENLKVPGGRIIVGKDVYDDLLGPPAESELALVVLNPQHKVETYLPWIPAVLLSQQKWIKPLPDGSGFYRIQFAEKEARIYFHALPK